MMDASAEEKLAVSTFTHRCHQIAGDFTDVNGQLAQLPNDVQSEYLQVMDYIPRLVPWMMRATMDSDLVRLNFLVDVMRDLMMSIESLISLEKEARREVLKRCSLA
jgi:hypothetical protein